MLGRVKETLDFWSLQFERRISTPFQIRFKSIEIAVVEEIFYEENCCGFQSCILFCHYDKDGLIIQQVREICLFFKALQIDVIFITTNVSDDSRKWLKENVSALIVRKNVGRDFGAWKDAISILKQKSLLVNCSQLYLVNDSLILISNHLNNERFHSEFINDTQSDVIGLTECWQGAYHLQSYFIKFNKSVIDSEVFHEFWNSYYLINSRQYSIENGEILLSQILLKSGYRLKALYSISELSRAENMNRLIETLLAIKSRASNKIKNELFSELFHYNFTVMNASHRLWPLLLVDGCPVLKRDLIEKNPEQLISMRYFMCLIEVCLDDADVKKLLHNSLQHLKTSRYNNSKIIKM